MDDQEIVGLIECFRERLRRLIIVEPLIDLLHFIEDDDKELIRVKLKTQGNLSAVDQLLDTITKVVRPQGWFKEFIDALETVGCMHAVCYFINSPPSPSLETENDGCVKLIRLLQTSLERMKTRDVCVSCYTLDILTEEDRDNIFAEIDNHGNARGARLLLRRVVRHEIGWFSTFLRALQKTGHPDLVKELLGEDLIDVEGDELYGQGNAPDATKDPELNVQSEGSHSPTGVALEASTHSVTGLLYDYMDGDTEIDLYTDPFEHAQQDISNGNKDSQTSGAPVKAPVEAPDAALVCPRVCGRTRGVPPIGSHAQSHGRQSGGNPLSAFRGRRPSLVRHYHHHQHHHALTASETLLRAAFSGQRCDDADDQETDSEADPDSSSDADTDGHRVANVDADLRTAFSGQRCDDADADDQETDSEAETDSSSEADIDGDRVANVDADADADECYCDDQGEDEGSVRGSDQDSHGYLSYSDDGNDYDDYYDYDDE